MPEITVISGKGGTGKTSLTAAFATLADRPVLADCDVDASDLHLVLAPRRLENHEFSGGSAAELDAAKCLGCGLCRDLCRFEAVRPTALAEGVRKFEVDAVGCEGCGLCARACPVGAIEMLPAVNGEWYVSETRLGPMVHARLGVAEENSGKLVTLVRRRAREKAVEDGRSLVLVDGAPGIGCPVIASVTGSDLAVIVTEPTVSGEHDLLRVLALTEHFRVPAMVCVNKYDINPEMSDRIVSLSESRGLEVAGRIRYDRSVTDAQMRMLTVIEHGSGPAAGDIRQTWRNIERYLEKKGKG